MSRKSSLGRSLLRRVSGKRILSKSGSTSTLGYLEGGSTSSLMSAYERSLEVFQGSEIQAEMETGEPE